MARQMQRLGAALPLVAGALMLGALRCGEPPEGAPDAAHDAGGAPGGQGGAAAGAGGAKGGTSGIGAVGGSSYDGGVWQPSADAGWTLVDWAECKALYHAKNPEQAAPPLVWKPCEGDIPGCQRLVVNWNYAFPPLSVPSPFTIGVHKQGGTLRFSFRLNIKGVGNVTAAYSEAMKPVAVWRGSASCKVWRAEWSEKHACVVAGGVPPATVGLLPFNAPNGAPIASFTSVADAPITCNSELFASLDAASRTFIRDLVANQAYEITWPNSLVGYPRVLGDIALVQRYGYGAVDLETGEAWVWTRPNKLTKLIDVAPQKVWDARTDGTTLAWVQVTATDTTEAPPGELWVSPATVDPAKLVPKKLRSVPPSGNSLNSNGIGQGYFVLAELRKAPDGPLKGAPDHRLHVYRLSDGRHWEVPRFVDVGPSTKKPASSLTVLGAVLHVDAEEVWWLGASQYSLDNWTIVRQRLSDLGPGD